MQQASCTSLGRRGTHRALLNHHHRKAAAGHGCTAAICTGSAAAPHTSLAHAPARRHRPMPDTPRSAQARTFPVVARISGRSLVDSTISMTRCSYTDSLVDWASACEMDSLIRWSLASR